MSPRLKEFLTASLSGLVVGTVTLSFRHVEIGPFLHILACAGIAGTLAVIVLAPHPGLIVASLVVLPAS